MMRNVLHKKEKQKHTLSMAPIEYIGSKQIENSFGRILKTFLLWNCHDDWIVIWYGRNDGHVLMLSCWCCSRKQDGFVVFPIFNIVNFCVRVIFLWTFIQASFLFQFQYFTSNKIYILQMKLLYVCNKTNKDSWFHTMFKFHILYYNLFVLLWVFSFGVLCCDVRHNFHLITMFGSSLYPVVCGEARVLYTLSLFCA